MPAAAWPAEAGRLEQSLRDVTERWQRELRERRRLQEALAVGDPPPDPDNGGSVGGGPCPPVGRRLPGPLAALLGAGLGPQARLGDAVAEGDRPAPGGPLGGPAGVGGATVCRGGDPQAGQEPSKA